VAAHILARRRFDVSGRFGLRASPGGFTTPAFGAGPEVVRVTGTALVREIAGQATSVPVAGSTLRRLAAFAGVDLGAAFSAGAATPSLGDVDAPIDLEPGSAAVIADWYHLGWQVLDGVVTVLPAEAAPATIQLWPEHFDAGTTVGLTSGDPVNLGFSAGDGFEAEPYAYLGPWSTDRPGDPAYWNAPFGAVLRRSDAYGAGAPADVCDQFMLRGLGLLSGR
jgi:hypothetical protein